MSIIVKAQHDFGSFALDVAFEARGRLTAIFGASGSGKTSLVNVVAGLIRPRMGFIEVNGWTLADTGNGVFLPAWQRRIGYVFQDARLFPHLSVLQNLRYGRWFAPEPKRSGDEAQVIGLLGIGSLLSRRPKELSGGERQRVAIGRALLSSPQLLLMDEPLASLDQPRKDEILPYIERLRDEIRIPIFYVSHSIAEVARLATDIVVLSNGKAAAFGPAQDIVRRMDLVPESEGDEASALLDMTIDSYDEAFDMTALRGSAGSAHVQGRVGDIGAKLRVRIRARDVMIAIGEPKHISALNIFRGVVAAIAEWDRSSVNVAINCGGSTVMARVTRLSAQSLELAPGKSVHAVVKSISVNRPGPVPL